MFSFQLKCFQLDLARQIETMDYLKEMLDLAAQAGYNSVLLYLEDRIRTASYRLQAEGQFYTPEQIRELNEYAAKKQIELIPCVASLGHAERFLAHPELEPLSEVQGEQKDKFGYISHKKLFCITHPDFYPFIETYLKEVAELFPSSFFHIGLDEFFDFRLCPRCRKAMPGFSDEEEAFLMHIRRIRDCLKTVGKRTMMWSDMFEVYTHVLPRIPQDVVVVDWQYQEDIRFYLGHLFEQGVENRIAQNNALGLTTVMGVAERTLGNPASAVDFSRKKKIPNFLLTTWEKSDTFLYRTIPIIFYVGRLLNNVPQKQAWQETMQGLFGTDDMLLSSAVHLAAADSCLRHFEEASSRMLRTRPFRGLPLGKFTRINVVQEMLVAARAKITTAVGRKIWKDIWNALEEKRIASELKSAFWDVFDFGFSQDALRRARLAEQDFHQLVESKSADWDAIRKGIPGNAIDARKEANFVRLNREINVLQNSSFLIIRFCMPDQYVINQYSIDLRFNGSWQNIVNRDGAKADNVDHDPFFEKACCFSCPSAPEAVRIRVTGMGGRGFAFVQIRTPGGECYVPDEVLESSGIVDHPEYMLNDDTKFAWFNNQSMRVHFLSEEAAAKEHCAVLSLKKANPADGLDKTLKYL